jgi:hypothetical protein
VYQYHVVRTNWEFGARKSGHGSREAGSGFHTKCDLSSTLLSIIALHCVAKDDRADGHARYG